MARPTISFLFLQRICTTLASLVILILLALEIVLGIGYIVFYLGTGLPTPMFALVEMAGEKLSSMKYVQDI